MKSAAGQAYSSVSLMSVGWCARFSNCTRGRPPHGNRPNRLRPAHADQHPDWSSRWCFSGWTTTGHQPARNRKRCAEWLRSRIAVAADMNPGVGGLVQECNHGMRIGTIGVAAITCRGRGQDCVEMLLASARPVRVPMAASRCRQCACRGRPMRRDGTQCPISLHCKDTRVR